MSNIVKGRVTAPPAGDVTVFLIGMRINAWWRPDKWLPVFFAMPRMLIHLAQHPESGFLGQHSWFGRTTILVSYWRSPDDLIRFAADRDAPHLEPWRAFRRRVGTSGLVGIWHETYAVRPGDREAVYANMPPFGLAKAMGSVSADGALGTAKARLRAGSAAIERSEDAVQESVTVSSSLPVDGS